MPTLPGWSIGGTGERRLGILVGPAVLKLAHPTDVVDGFSNIGLAFLMFLAGYELDLRRVRGRPLALATWGWLLSLVMAMGFAFALVFTGFALDRLIVGLALTTTALGTLLPVVTDAGLLDSRFGTQVTLRIQAHRLSVTLAPHPSTFTCP